MWILSILSVSFATWLAYIIILAGIAGLVVSYFAGFFTRFIPSLLAIKIPVQIVSIIFLVYGVYLSGGIAQKQKYEAEIQAMQQKVITAEQKAKDASAKIEYVFLDRVKTVKDVQVVVQEKIKTVETIIDAKCEVPQEAVELLNMAAKNKLTETKK